MLQLTKLNSVNVAYKETGQHRKSARAVDTHTVLLFIPDSSIPILHNHFVSVCVIVTSQQQLALVAQYGRAGYTRDVVKTLTR